MPRIGVPGDGSSPRSRGTLARKARRKSSDRFIPALAGNTAGKRLAFTTLRFIPALAGETPASDFIERHPVHPRARGEHVTL
jgi:hypothetical protein